MPWALMGTEQSLMVERGGTGLQTGYWASSLQAASFQCEVQVVLAVSVEPGCPGVTKYIYELKEDINFLFHRC